MVRIAGVNLPEQKCVEIALTYVFGIGLTTSKKILSKTKIDPTLRVKDLSEEQVKIITSELQGMVLEGELKQINFRNVKRLKDIKCYRGIRHRLGLPVRGQNTRTNAVTRKGRNNAVGGLKRKIEKT
jgi:small subunit ribosomal protein S13